jgi:hypothetical protein
MHVSTRWVRIVSQVGRLGQPCFETRIRLGGRKFCAPICRPLNLPPLWSLATPTAPFIPAQGKALGSYPQTFESAESAIHLVAAIG